MKTWHIIILIVALLSIVAVVSSTPFRLYPTHLIVKQVNCFSCHADEFNDLKEGRHVIRGNATHSRSLYDYVDIYGNVSETHKSLQGPCYSCHITYDNFNLFGLTDPYTFGDPNESVNAQYGYVISWPSGNKSVEYFDTDNTTIYIELELLDISPLNFSVDSTIKVIFSNYSGQQTGTTIYDSSKTLHKGDIQNITINNVLHDYFSIVLLLDGIWNNTLINITVNGTDKSTESFSIISSTWPAIYSIPKDVSDKSYFKTDGTYKATRLDYMWYEWRSYSWNSTTSTITSSEDIQTNSTSGWITKNTCLSADVMCHIVQKATYIGLSDGLNPDGSFYPHEMEYVTSKQCKLCHLK